jgi:hypothetical protein
MLCLAKLLIRGFRKLTSQYYQEVKNLLLTIILEDILKKRISFRVEIVSECALQRIVTFKGFYNESIRFSINNSIFLHFDI